MADEQLTSKPVVPIDATTQFTATAIISGVRKVVQIAQSDLKGLDGKSAIATITNTTPAPIPAVGQQVQYAVTESGLEVNQIVSVGGVGTLKVLGNPTTTSIVLENIDATPGAVVTGAKIFPSGPGGIDTHFVTALPANTLGKDKDIAFRNTGEIYKKVVGAWVLQVNYASEIETDPFPQYLTQAEGTALFAPLGVAGQGGMNYSLVLGPATAASGQITFNNSAIASATSISISESDRNSASMVEGNLGLIATDTRIKIQSENDEEIYAWFKVTGAPTDNGTYRTIPVAFVSASGTMTAGEVAVILTASGGGGVSGLQYTYIGTAGTPTAGQIRSADINFVGLSTVTISATDAQTNPKSTADVLARLKVGAIIEIAASQANKVRGTISADYSATTNSFNWDGQIPSGAIANNATVYLSIVSDAVSTSGGGHVIRDEGIDLPQRGKIDFVGAGVTATDDAAGDLTVVTIAGGGGAGFTGGTISAVWGATSATISESTAPSGSTWPVYSYQWYSALTSGFNSAGNLVSGATASTLSLSGLSNGTQYFVRRVVTDAAGAKAATPEISFTTTGANPAVVALTNALTAQGYTVTSPEQTAIEAFFTAIGAQNAAATGTLQSAFARFRGFLGNSFNTCKIDWLDPANTAKYLTAVGTVTYSATGITTGAASSGLLEDYQIPAANQDNFGYGLYLSSVPVANTRYMGATMLATTTKTDIQAGNSPNFVQTINGAGTISANVTTYTKGLVSVVRTAATACYTRIAGVNFTSTEASQADATFYDTANSKLLIGAMRRSDGTVVGSSGTKAGCSFILNKGVSTADITSIENAINALMVALARN
jgi:hypothetical protein